LPTDIDPLGTGVPTVTIYNPDGSVAGHATHLVIPAGPPRGPLTLNGQNTGVYSPVGPPGPYIVIDGHGELDMAGLTLTGSLRFELSKSGSGLVISLVVDVNGHVNGIPGGAASTELFGAIQIDSDGIIVLLQATVTGGGTPTDY